MREFGWQVTRVEISSQPSGRGGAGAADQLSQPWPRRPEPADTHDPLHGWLTNREQRTEMRWRGEGQEGKQEGCLHLPQARLMQSRQMKQMTMQTGRTEVRRKKSREEMMLMMNMEGEEKRRGKVFLSEEKEL